MPGVPESNLISSLEALELIRDVRPASLIERSREDPVADLTLRLVVKVASLDDAAVELRKAARQVTEARTSWEPVSTARGDMVFMNRLGGVYKVPKELAQALVEGADLDADVDTKEVSGTYFTTFAYGKTRVTIPSSLYRQLALPDAAETR